MAKAEAKANGAPAKRGRGKWLLGLPLLLAFLGAGLWFGGILPPLFGLGAQQAEAAAPPPGTSSPLTAGVPVFIELPEIVSNINAPGRRASFVKLRAQLELGRSEDIPAVEAAMPRLLDLFSTYLREVRPEELRGSAGSHRLREELIARAALAAAPVRILDVLFVEMLVQ